MDPQCTCIVCYDDDETKIFYGFKNCFPKHSFCFECLLHCCEYGVRCPVDAANGVSVVKKTNNTESEVKDEMLDLILPSLFCNRQMINILHKDEDLLSKKQLLEVFETMIIADSLPKGHCVKCFRNIDHEDQYGLKRCFRRHKHCYKCAVGFLMSATKDGCCSERLSSTFKWTDRDKKVTITKCDDRIIRLIEEFNLRNLLICHAAKVMPAHLVTDQMLLSIERMKEEARLTTVATMMMTNEVPEDTCTRCFTNLLKESQYCPEEILCLECLLVNRDRIKGDFLLLRREGNRMQIPFILVDTFIKQQINKGYIYNGVLRLSVSQLDFVTQTLRKMEEPLEEYSL